MEGIRPAETQDWEAFFSCAETEGWRVPQVERRAFAGPWRGCALALTEDGRFAGLVTAVPHQHSGWIGNLIVPVEMRGRGCGVRLFEAALAALATAGTSVCWLTASPAGRPLYQRRGFVAIDRIERWVLSSAPGVVASNDSGSSDRADHERLHRADELLWREQRTTLLDFLQERGRTCVRDDSVALLQQNDDLQIIGPWYAPDRCPRANRLLLQDLLAAAEPGREIVTDVLASSPLKALLANAGFTCHGSSELMVRGAVDIELQSMVALASLGSVA